ncbi:hypothetical protein K7432_004234 [Basidiobolus ranarum]|uniref:F-box domain-containing protein n=1 Tax=Basidiobolus ranarum TaxID=34480 RepID=A0ABR2WYL0_9FUNG
MKPLNEFSSSVFAPISSRINGELLHLIFTFLLDSPKDIYSCSLVNIEWSSFATPLLWKKPVFHSQSSLISFMNVVAVNHNVARYVRELDLERYKGNLLSLHLIERLIKFLPGLHTLSMLSFDNYTHRRPDTSFLNSLFFTLPNLKRLTFTATTCDPNLFNDIAYVIEKCPHLEEMKLLMNYNPTTHVCQKPSFDKESLEIFEQIESLKRLRSLEIAGPFVDLFLWKIILPRTPNLTKLSIAGGAFTSHYIRRIHHYCPHIRSLNLVRFDDPLKIFDQVCIDLANHFPGRLTELCISLSSMREISPVLWKCLNQSVTSISLYNTRIINAQIKTLAEHIGENLHTLRLQNVTHNQRPGIRAWTTLLSKCGTGLSVLDVSMNHLMNDRIGHLISHFCRSLRSLSLAKTKITEDSLESMIYSNRNQLKHLNVNGIHLNAQIICAIGTHGKKLRNLHLQMIAAQTDNTSLRRLFRAIGKQLEFLDIRGRAVNGKLCKAITEWCPNLRAISFCNQTQLQDEDVLSLLLLRSNVQVLNLHCPNCFFVKGGLTTDLINRIREHGIFGDTWWYQEFDRDCISPYHKLAGMLD